MKRYISPTRTIDMTDVLVEDKIVINIDIDCGSPIAASYRAPTNRFPGIDQFRQDVVDILENKYGFDVIEDNYRGVDQKGYISNREGSVSIYFDTYYDLCNSSGALARRHFDDLEVPNRGVVYCYIHIRFSDHTLNDHSDVAHLRFIKDNAEHYASLNPNVTKVYPDEDVVLSGRDMQFYYDEALDRLEDQLDEKIVSWVKEANRILRRND